ncbi:MAG: histidine--tRNA ligase [Thermoplasmata archaeon]
MIERPRGTRDMFPEEMEKRRFVEEKLRSVVESFGYGEIITPSFEHTQLFLEKSGPSIVDEIYAFKDKGNREIALRPEFTASVMRMYHEGMRERPKPLKLYYFGPVFRYERPQAGRYREFWHFGTELIGPDTPAADAENIALAYNCISSTGLQDFTLRISNLNILSTYLSEKGVPDPKKDEIFHNIDKGELDQLKEYRFGDELIELLDSEDTEDYLKDGGPVTYLRKVLELLENYGISSEGYNIDLSTVRGLDYYRGVVFEIDAEGLGAEKQTCGGGDYQLGSIFGTNVTAKGFAFGFDRLVLALGDEMETLVNKESKCYIIPIGEESKEYSFDVLMELRDNNVTSDLDLMDRGIGKALSYADRTGFNFAMLIGGDEMENQTVTVKDMKTGEQKSVPRKNILSFVKEKV